MTAWTAICITVIAATANNVGKAMQKEATRSLPRFSLQGDVWRQYIASRSWLAGLGADLGGALLMIAAFALAPVSLVQPVSSVGLVSLALLQHFWLRERLAAGEWAAVALAGVGTIGLGATTEGAPPDAATAASPLRMAAVVVLTLMAIGATSLHRMVRHQHRRKQGAPKREGAYVLGLQAGACFGLSAACCRTGLLMAQKRVVYMPVGLAASVALTSAGFTLQTVGLKDGNSLVVCTAAAVSSMVSGVVVGVAALGERLPASPAGRAARLASWLLVLAGVAALAAGSGGALQLLGAVAVRLPERVWAILPPRAASLLRTAARAYRESELLPQVISVNAVGSPLAVARTSHRMAPPPPRPSASPQRMGGSVSVLPAV